MHDRELAALQLLALDFGLSSESVRQRSDFLSRSPLYNSPSIRNKPTQGNKDGKRSRRKATKAARKRNRPH
jgi:hypothetical protein